MASLWLVQVSGLLFVIFVSLQDADAEPSPINAVPLDQPLLVQRLLHMSGGLSARINLNRDGWSGLSDVLGDLCRVGQAASWKLRAALCPLPAIPAIVRSRAARITGWTRGSGQRESPEALALTLAASSLGAFAAPW